MLRPAGMCLALQCSAARHVPGTSMLRPAVIRGEACACRNKFPSLTCPTITCLSSEVEAASPLPRLALGRGALTVRLRPQGALTAGCGRRRQVLAAVGRFWPPSAGPGRRSAGSGDLPGDLLGDLLGRDEGRGPHEAEGRLLARHVLELRKRLRAEFARLLAAHVEGRRPVRRAVVLPIFSYVVVTPYTR